MTFANHTPPGQSPFIAGPYPGLGTVYGEYAGIATVNLPGDARDIASPSAHSVVTSGPEGPTILEGATMHILAGATQQHHVHLRAARGRRLHECGAERTNTGGDLACLRPGRDDDVRRQRSTHHLVVGARGRGQPSSAVKAARLWGTIPR